MGMLLSDLQNNLGTVAQPDASLGPLPPTRDLNELSARLSKRDGASIGESGLSAPAQAATSTLTPEQRLREVTEFGGDPGRLGFKVRFDDDGSMRSLFHKDTGEMAAVRDFRTGAWRTEKFSVREISGEAFTRLLPQAIQPMARDLNAASPGDIVRFGLEVAAGNAAGTLALGARAAGALAKSSRFARAVAPAAASAAGAAGASLLSETFNPTEEPLRHAAIIGSAEAFGSGVGDLLGTALSRFASGGFGGLEPGSHEAMRFMRRKNIPSPTPGRLTTSRTVDVLETMSESSLTGSKLIQENNDRAQALMQSELDDYVSRFTRGASKVDVENLMIDTLERRGESFKAAGGALYKRVDTLIPKGTGVDITDAVAEAEEVLRKATLGMREPVGKEAAEAVLKNVTPAQAVQVMGPNGASLLDASGKPLTRTIPADNVVSWETAFHLRSQFLRVRRPANEIIEGEGKTAAGRLIPKIDAAMTDAAHSLDQTGEAYKAWRAASRFWSEGADIYDSRFIKSLAKAEPDQFYQIAIKKNRPQNIARLRRVIIGADDPASEIRRLKRIRNHSTNQQSVASATAQLTEIESGLLAWQSVQGHFLNDLIGSKAVKASEILSPLRIPGAAPKLVPRRDAGTMAKRLADFGDESLKEIFTAPAQRKSLQTILRVLDVTQREAGKNIPGKIFIQLNQAGAAYAVMTGGPPSQALVFVAPYAIARTLTNPRAQRWILEGRRAWNNLPAAMRAWNGFAAVAIAEGAEYRGDDPRLREMQTKRDRNFGPGSPRTGSKEPGARVVSRTALP